MSYYQYNQQQHHFQPGQVLIQPWQRELGCPTPRPRSWSLGSRPVMSSSTDLFEVASKRPHNPAPTILPLDNSHNSYNKKRHHSGSSRCGLRSLLVLVILAASLVATLGWWKLRRHSPTLEPTNEPRVVVAPPEIVHQQPQQSAYHPLPPPPPALVPPSWQQQQQPQQPHQYHHHQEQHYPYQQQQQQYSAPQHHQYNQHYGYNHYQQPQYVQQAQQFHPQHHQHQQQYSYQQPPLGHHPEMMHHQGEPVARKSWVLEHMEEPPVVHQQQQYFHQQPEQQPPVEPIVAEPQPEMTRQEERAQARKDARTMNPKKEAKEDDSIWETEKIEANLETMTADESSPELRLESAENSFSEFFESNETVILTSFEDNVEITIETVME